VRARGFTALDVQQGRFDDDDTAIRAIVGECIRQLADQIDPAALTRTLIEPIERLRRFHHRKCACRIDALDIEDAAMVSRRDADEPPGEIELFGSFLEQAYESPGHVAEADKRDRQFRIGHAGEPADCDAGSVVSN
jgi:hypothetical protein